MTKDNEWIGDLGHLALADASLGVLLVDMLSLLAHAGYPAGPSAVDTGKTTRQSARAVQGLLSAQPELFGDTAGDWLSDLIAVTELRNELLHAVALNRCSACGTASRFLHPRSGREVDRSEQVVRDVTAQALALYKTGMVVAAQIAERVNARIVAGARLQAEATGEVQNPPQVYPHQAVHECANCAGNGRGRTTMAIGTAVEVYPREQLQALMDGQRSCGPDTSRIIAET
ncbi:hypothetical protein [Dactylosporangium sp. NPDC050588]|uniref:hypothetical protein n=1 Tax=Dactylosporangium sp. NPDC050588 TaxID=3157211 RepID=UPI0033DEABAA